MLLIVDQLFGVVVEETSAVLKPRDVVYFPGGVPHSLTKPGDGFGEVISIHRLAHNGLASLEALLLRKAAEVS